jgi:hypothetical protein
MKIRYPHGCAAWSALAVTALSALSLSAIASAQSPPAPAHAQPMAAPQVVEVSRTPFQEYVPFADADSTASPYRLGFSRVPARSRLEISNVSCYIASQYGSFEGAQIEYVQLLVLDADGSLVTASTLAPVPVSTLPPRSSGGAVTWAINNQVAAFAPARHRFQILFGAAPNNFHYLRLACHISGQMVKLG